MPKRKKKIAIMVVAPECSATRLVTRLLIAAGCHGVATAEGRPEYSGWPQPYDIEDPQGETPVVIRRTLPYHPNREWPDLDALVDRMERIGYEIRVVVLARDRACTIESQLSKHYIISREQGVAEIKRCYKEIRACLKKHKLMHEFFNYEDIVSSPLQTVNAIMSFAKCKTFKTLPEEIRDENAKWREA